MLFSYIFFLKLLQQCFRFNFYFILTVAKLISELAVELTVHLLFSPDNNEVSYCLTINHNISGVYISGLDIFH